jgi:hypothetical protein
VDTTTGPYDRRLLLLASLAGMGAVIVLPLSAVAPAAVVPLVFSLPLLLGVIARMRALPWLLNVASVLLVLTALGVAPVLGVLNVVPAAVILVGPIVAVVVVGAPLREVDVVAAGGFLLSGTIAVIGGFAAGALPGAAWLVVGVALIGLVVVGVRLDPRGNPDRGV